MSVKLEVKCLVFNHRVSTIYSTGTGTSIIYYLGPSLVFGQNRRQYENEKGMTDRVWTGSLSRPTHKLLGQPTLIRFSLSVPQNWVLDR